MTHPGEQQQVVPFTEQELHAAIRDPRYWRHREPDFVRRVVEGFRLLAKAVPAPAPAPSTERERIMLTALKHALRWHDQLGKADLAIMEAAIKLAEGEP